MTVLEISHCLAKHRITGRKFFKMRREKTEELQKGAPNDERFDKRMIVHVSTIIFGVLRIMSVLAVARRMLLMQWHKYAKC